MQQKLGRHTIVLLGVGHTNAHVLRMWKMQPISNANLVCVSNFPVATYSGMLPGVLSGQYSPQQMEIDLVRFCATAGARLIVGEVTGLDRGNRRLEFADRPPLHYDLLSIGIGSRPSFEGVSVESDRLLIAVKPMQTFLDRMLARLSDLSQQDSSAPPTISIVGGGVGSIEIAFCLHQRLHRVNDNTVETPPLTNPPRIQLITASETLGDGLLSSTQRRVRNELQSRGVEILTGKRVTRIAEDALVFDSGERTSAGLVIWATHAAPLPLLSKLDLETDSDGFLLTRPTLQCVNDDHVFAVGDTGTIQGSRTAKAGVFAVRQGPVLWNNLNRSVWHPPLEEYYPQSGFLKLINTGDGKAIGEYKGIGFYSRWAWKLKDWIDRRFMAKYQDYEPMKLTIHHTEEDEVMRCLGCGGKIGSRELGRVLDELNVPDHDDVVIGLAAREDAAVLRTHDNQVTVTTDFFASPINDPYVVGRIAALNSASDCFVMGAQPTSALAHVQLPVGNSRSQTELMRELMQGGAEEFSQLGAAIVGGHSIEGPRLTVGFTVLGRRMFDPHTKSGLKAGDRLILSKPLGTGVLLAAVMQGELPASAWQPLIDTMLQSNAVALTLMQAECVSAMTDVTGFGLAGHLVEMLQASQVSASVFMSRVPLLPTCQNLIDAGIQSTLAPDNRSFTRKIEVDVDDLESPAIASLFDPQTSGGLLFGVADNQVEPALEILNENGFESSTVIGEITATTGSSGKLHVSH